MAKHNRWKPQFAFHMADDIARMSEEEWVAICDSVGADREEHPEDVALREELAAGQPKGKGPGLDRGPSEEKQSARGAMKLSYPTVLT